MKPVLKNTLISVLALLVLIFGALTYLVHRTPATADFGTRQDLSACPIDKPRCVSSLNQEAKFQIAAFGFSDDPETAMARLKAAVAAQPDAEVIYADAQHLDVTFKTLLMRFRDDVRFQLNAEAKRFEVRSSSRVGYSDLGVNRKRLEQIRTRFGARSDQN